MLASDHIIDNDCALQRYAQGWCLGWLRWRSQYEVQGKLTGLIASQPTNEGRSLKQIMAGFPRDTSPVSETSGCGPIFWLLLS